MRSLSARSCGRRVSVRPDCSRALFPAIPANGDSCNQHDQPHQRDHAPAECFSCQKTDQRRCAQRKQEQDQPHNAKNDQSPCCLSALVCAAAQPISYSVFSFQLFEESGTAPAVRPRTRARIVGVQVEHACTLAMVPAAAAERNVFALSSVNVTVGFFLPCEQRILF